MKRTICAVSFVFAILLFASFSFAGPFLVCDPNAGVGYYKLTGPAWVPTTNVTAQADGSIKLDVSAATVGVNALTVAACKADATWGELCSVTVPFSFTRPALPTAPTTIKLAP
jgi:hypothetical protein